MAEILQHPEIRRKVQGGGFVQAFLSLAQKMVAYVFAILLQCFDWILLEGMELDFSDKFGIILKKSDPLVAIPTARLSYPELYN